MATFASGTITTTNMIYEGWITQNATASTTSTATWTAWVTWTDEWGDQHREPRENGTVMILPGEVMHTPDEIAAYHSLHAGERARILREQQQRNSEQHTPEEIAEHHRQMQQIERDRQSAVQKSITAMRRVKRKAKIVLLRALTPEQREEFKQFGYVHVTGGKTQRRYRIREGRMGNIDVLDKAGKVRHRLCAHPREDLPDYDVMLTQVLYLRDAENEEGFLSIANRH